MTKDTEKVLRLLYKSYKARRENQPRSIAKQFSAHDIAEVLKEIAPADRREALAELRDDGYIELYMLNSCVLLPKAIEYGETSVERTAEKVLDVWSKLH